MKAEFKKGFDEYVCEGDTITTEHEGITYTASLVRDEGYGIDDDDIHNVDQSVTGCNDEQQEKLLFARAKWFAGEWWYCGLSIVASVNGHYLGAGKGFIIPATSLWALEANYPGSDNSYLLEVANEILPEAIEQARKDVAELLAALLEVSE